MSKGTNAIYRVLAVTLCWGYSTVQMAQEPVRTLGEVRNNFEKLVTSSHQEKVFVHTDKSVYLTGETVWFKTYCLKSSSHKLSSLSKVLNVDLIDPQGRAVHQIRVRLIGGIGKGQMAIGPKMVSGAYTLRAYTSWMRNFDQDLIFQKDLSIINPSARAKSPTKAQKEGLIMEFFAEGGDLINGVNCKVAVKVTDSVGFGKNVAGAIFDSDGAEVVDFVTSERGLGSFFLLPEPNKSYYALIANGKNQAFRADLPAPRSTGYSINVESDDRSFEVTIRSISQPNGLVYLITHTRGILKMVEQNVLSEGATRFIIPKESLPNGISHLTVMNDLFQPLCERLIFKHPEEPPLVHLGADKPNYTNREKVKINIRSQGTVPANLSLSVSRHDKNLKSKNGTAVSNLLLVSDLKGSIESPDYYFDTSKEGELDDLLLTHGWRRFLWEEVLTGESIPTAYLPEFSAPIVAGKVTSDNPENERRSIFLGFPGRELSLYSVELKADGTFYFEVPFRINNSAAILWSLEDTLIDGRVEIEPSFLPPLGPGTKRYASDPRLVDYVERTNANIQIEHTYLTETRITGVKMVPGIVVAPFYGTPELKYNLDDYTRFVDMKEVFIEYVRSVFVKQRSGKNYFDVVMGGPPVLQVPDLDALVLLDGVPISDSDHLLELDPLIVNEIHVVNELYSIGYHLFNGIVSFLTYEGDRGGASIPSDVIEKAYTALQNPREFYSPDYSIQTNNQNRIPDFRNTLYWESDLIVEKDGQETVQFFTSDDHGDYKVVIQGISEEGTPIYAETYFGVGGGL